MSLLNIAVRNNAEWCERVALSHGVDCKWLTDAWFTTSLMPPFYPNVVSLKPGIDEESILALEKDLPEHCCWKDSFGELKLEQFGFKVILESSWYACLELNINDPCSELTGVVTSKEEQREWIDSWGETPSEADIFLPALPGSQVKFIFSMNEGRMVSGLIANVGDSAVGISNTFGNANGIAQCVKFAFDWANGLPLVGYGSHDELCMMEKLGFEGVGKLRVWLR